MDARRVILADALAHTSRSAAAGSPRRTELDVQSAAPLGGAVVLVTGAARGIGNDIARAFAASDARLLVADVDGEALADALRDLPAATTAVVADVSSPTDVDAMFARVEQEFGRIDVVVNNAGVVHADPFLDLPLETWRRVLRVNLDGTFLVSQAASRMMREQEPSETLGRRGMIINVSSLAADVGRPTLAAYGASKAAINHLSKTLAVTLAPDGISTAVVYPGNVKEGMWGYIGPLIAAAEGRDAAEVEGEREFQLSADCAEIVRDLAAVSGLELSGALVLSTREICDI